MSFTEYPRAVQPFIADGIVEAAQTASMVMRQDHIKGAYWTNLRMLAPDRAQDLQLRDAFTKATRGSSEDVSRRFHLPVRSALIALPGKKSEDGALDVRMGFANHAPSAIPYIDEARLAVLDALTSIFSQVTLSIHLEYENFGKPHCDTDPVIKNPNPAALFEGRHIRILIPRDLLSTEIYDTDFQTLENSRHSLLGRFRRLPEPWTMACGNALFFGGLGWGKDKALVHGSPNFKLRHSEHPRTLDVYDCVA